PPHFVERPGAQRGDVRAHPYRWLKMDRLVRIAGVHRRYGGVGDHPPVLRHDRVPREHTLEVGLVETGERTLRVGDLELTVQVDLAVDRVDTAGDPLTGVGVGEVGVHHQGVVLRQA